MHDRQAAFDRVLDTVRGIRLVLDAEMQGITSGLEVLAASQSLARGDLDAFRGSAEAFLSRFPEGAAISLAARDGRQLLNTGAAPGAPLPPRRQPCVHRRGVSNGATGLFQPVRRLRDKSARTISVSVPVVRNAMVVDELSFDPPLALFQNIIRQLRPSDDWTMSFFDRTGVNFARVPNPEQTIGQSASPTLYAHLFDQREAKVETISLEGVPLLTAFTRSPLTGWTVAAGLSVASLTEPLWQALAITASVGLVMLVIGLAFAFEHGRPDRSRRSAARASRQRAQSSRQEYACNGAVDRGADLPADARSERGNGQIRGRG